MNQHNETFADGPPNWIVSLREFFCRTFEPRSPCGIQVGYVIYLPIFKYFLQFCRDAFVA